MAKVVGGYSCEGAYWSLSAYPRKYSLSIGHQRFPLFSSSLPELILRVWSRCGPKRYKTWGFQFKACLVTIPRCFFPAWPVHLHFVRPICIWMGALPDISHRTPFVPVSVHVTFTFLLVQRNERCEWNYTGMNVWEVNEGMTEWSKEERMEGKRLRRTIDVI